MGMRSIGISMLKQRECPFATLQPRELGANGKAIKQTASPLQPTVGNSTFSPKCPAVPRQPYGDARRGCLVFGFEKQTIRSFTRVEDEIGQIEPPRSESQAFQSCGSFLLTNRNLKGFAGIASVPR
jgi:hypothetical protein